MLEKIRIRVVFLNNWKRFFMDNFWKHAYNISNTRWFTYLKAGKKFLSALVISLCNQWCQIKIYSQLLIIALRALFDSSLVRP
jgi:hypothetical protein